MPRIFCCWRRSYKLRDGIPKLKYLKEMDKTTILRVLDFCAKYYPDETAAACSGYLERPRKLDWEQKGAVVETLLSILRHVTVSRETYDSVFKTTVKLLQQPVSSFTDLQINSCRVLVQIGFKLPDLVLGSIIEFFKLRTIPLQASAWCLKQLILQKEAAIKHSEGVILENFLPVMENARNFPQHLHFSGVFEALASAFVQSTEAEHAPQYLRGYLICKAYLEAPCKNTEEMCRIRERVLLALSPITPLLPPDQLAMEIPILIREVLFLQGSLPEENSFSLIKPLEQFIQAGVSKSCKEAFSPEIFTALHNLISAPGPLSDKAQAAQEKAKELLLLLETHQITLLKADDQASGIERPLGTVTGGIQKNRNLAPHHGHSERPPKLLPRRTGRHRRTAFKFDPRNQITMRRRLPATFRPRHESAQVTTLLHNVAGREMYPPFTTSEDTLGQRTSPNAETTENEMEPSRPDMLETIESTSLIPYDHGRQRQPLWFNLPEMIQSSSTITVIQIDPYSGTETQPLWFNLPEMIQSSSTIIVIQIDPYSGTETVTVLTS